MNARLKLLHEKANVKQVKLLPTTVVGRSTECDLKIASSQVSRVHCRITVAEDAVYVEDLGSANGTFVDDQMLTPRKPTAVQPGAKITIGPAEFLVDYIAPTSNTVVVRRSGNGAKPSVEDPGSDLVRGEKELIFTTAADEPAPDSEATMYGARMENLVAAAMDAIQAENSLGKTEPPPAPKVEEAKPPQSVNPVPVFQPAAVSLPAVEPAPVPPPAPKPVVVAPPPPLAAPAPAVAAVPVAPIIAAAVAVPVKPPAPAARVVTVAPVAAPVAKAVAVPTARAVPVQPPAAAVIPRAVPAAPVEVNPFQFVQDAPIKPAPVSPPAKTVAPPAKPAPPVVVAAPAPPVIAAPPVFVDPQPFAPFAEPESNPVTEEASAFDFAADPSPSRTSKPSAKPGKAAAGGLKSLLSVFGRKPASPAKKAATPSPEPEAVEEPPESPEPQPTEAVDEPAPFAFGAAEPAAEVEAQSNEPASGDDDFQNFLKQF